MSRPHARRSIASIVAVCKKSSLTSGNTIGSVQNFLRLLKPTSERTLASVGHFLKRDQCNLARVAIHSPKKKLANLVAKCQNSPMTQTTRRPSGS